MPTFRANFCLSSKSSISSTYTLRTFGGASFSWRRLATSNGSTSAFSFLPPSQPLAKARLSQSFQADLSLLPSRQGHRYCFSESLWHFLMASGEWNRFSGPTQQRFIELSDGETGEEHKSHHEMVGGTIAQKAENCDSTTELFSGRRQHRRRSL